VGGAGNTLDVQDVLARVGHHFGEEQLGVGPDGVLPLLEVVRILDEGHRDAELLQGVGQQVVRAAVQAGAGNHVVAGFGDIEDGEGFGCLPGAQRLNSFMTKDVNPLIPGGSRVPAEDIPSRLGHP
jgi:hypothetical protein